MSSTQYSLVHFLFFFFLSPNVGGFVRFLKLSVHRTLKFKINVDLSTEMTRQFYIQETGCPNLHNTALNNVWVYHTDTVFMSRAVCDLGRGPFNTYPLVGVIEEELGVVISHPASF